MGLKHSSYFWTGFALCFFLVSCAGFSIKYYGMSEVSYEQGMLLGPKEGDDLPFSKCAPTAENKNPCIVMFAKEFFALKQEFLDTRSKLEACERR